MGWYNSADMSAGGWIAMTVMMPLFWDWSSAPAS